MPYNQKHVWCVVVLNPTDNSVIQTSTHFTINDIHNTYQNISLSTWRNICMGRSKIYSKFIKVTKVLKKNIETEFLKKKLKQNDISELYEKYTSTKFITWLFQSE